MTLPDFFFNTPIYSKILIDEFNDETFKQIIDKTVSPEFFGYNPIEKMESTFRVITDLIPHDENFVNFGGFGTVEIQCKRSDTIFTFYILWQPKKKELTKIGQYPSVADFHLYEVKQYTKLLPNEKLKEFTRAIGLAANGIGIGSFVYLRRIFEFLINDAYSNAKKDNKVNDEEFQRARMDEKINLLQDYLPNFLLENKALYPILSLGVHELDEKTCLANFDTLRVSIEIILDEKLSEVKKREKIEMAKKKLAELKGQIKK
jgi:hypothetical protein